MSVYFIRQIYLNKHFFILLFCNLFCFTVQGQVCPSVTNTTTSDKLFICSGNTTTLTVSATVTSDSVFWYSDSLSTTPIASGLIYITPQLFDTSIFWVSQHDSCISAKIPIQINVNNKPLPYIETISVTQSTICEGDSIQITTTGLQTSSFIWNGAFANSGNNYLNPHVVYLYKHHISVGGVVSEFFFSRLPIAYANGNAKMVMYEDVNGNVGKRVAYSNVASNPTFAGSGIYPSVAYSDTIGAGDYWIGIIFDQQNPYKIIYNGASSRVYYMNFNDTFPPNGASGFYSNGNVAFELSVRIQTLPATSAKWLPSVSVVDSTAFNPFVFPTSATVYTIVASNSFGCTNTSSIGINVNPKPTVYISASPSDTICMGDTVQLSATGAQSYYWGNNVNPSTDTTISNNSLSGFYDLTAIDSNGCVRKDTIEIIATRPPVIDSVISSNSTICEGDSVQLQVVAHTLNDTSGNLQVATQSFIFEYNTTYTKVHVNNSGMLSHLIFKSNNDGNHIKMAIYSNGKNNKPDKLLAQTNATTIQTFSTMYIPVVQTAYLPIGDYWIAMKVDATFYTAVNSNSSMGETYTNYENYNDSFLNAVSFINPANPEAIGVGAVTQSFYENINTSWTNNINAIAQNGNVIITSPTVATNYFAHVNLSACSIDTTISINVNPKYSILILDTPFTTSYTLPWGTAVYNSGNYAQAYSSITGCDSVVTYSLSFLPKIQLNAKLFLSGPYVQSAGLMHDSLRFKKLIPLVEPYSILPYNTAFTHIKGGGETTDTTVLAITGTNAIVDWVFVQLRSAIDSSIVLATKAALLQRDGDVVNAADGISPIIFRDSLLPAGQYFISIKHRNHLGVMTRDKITLSDSITLVDFTNINTSLYRREAPNNNTFAYTATQDSCTRKFGAVRALYGGNSNILTSGVLPAFRIVRYNGINNDRLTLLNFAGALGNIVGYTKEDLNMDGRARYNGINNDRLFLLQNIGSSSNTTIHEQLPN